MVKPICKDTFILSQKAQPATQKDISVAVDLLDTLKANSGICVGLAANMIGVPKAIIAISIGPMMMAMLNPVITDKKGRFETEEGCLSLIGVRKTDRYETITVEYQDMNMKKHKQTFQGFTAQIIQHEVDHLFGILI
ncbi:MAG: peptide deformylase [Clostridiales bacterium]|nr:peptide deformylase [Clostridiales bacterium]